MDNIKQNNKLHCKECLIIDKMEMLEMFDQW